ncbi:MAG: hypothetical protein R3E91_04060 [Chlamydiales bacterium]
MQIAILGISHKSADLTLREKLAKVCHRQFGSNKSIHPSYAYVLLSTCNRIEIYFSSIDLAKTHTHLLEMLRGEMQEEFEPHIYSYFGNNCFSHLARVTAGFDSVLMGETEIQGQVKQAYEEAISVRFLSRELHFLFQKCLKIGKNIRSRGAIFQKLPKLEGTILQAGQILLGHLEKKTILFVGFSEINRKIFFAFKSKGILNMTFCSRSYEKEDQMAQKENIQFLPWNAFHKWSTFDFIIFATKYPDFLVLESSKVRKKTLIIDLSVPRNVHPQLGKNKQITLLNIDQLGRLMDRRKGSKDPKMGQIEMQLIAETVEQQVSLFKLKELQRLQTVFSTRSA